MKDRLKGWWKRVRALVRRARVEAELEEEVAFHLAMEEAQQRARGLSPAAARRAARLAFGGLDRFKEGVRDVRGFRWIEDLGRDLRDAGRALGRAPGFTLVATLTLGLGIGSAVTVFGVVDAVLVRPLPLPAAERLVHVWETSPEGRDFPGSEPDYLDFRARNRTLAELAAYRIDRRTLTGRGEPERVVVLAASYTIFPALELEPLLGRAFSADEDRPGGDARVALMGAELWRGAFGGDSAVVGTTVVLDGEPYVVIGVAPPWFPLADADLWVPLAADPTADRTDHWLDLVGRLDAGATLDQARADLLGVARTIGAEHPEVAGWGVRLAGLTDFVVGPQFRRTGGLLLGAVGFLLLMTCVTVANLLLARALARRTDVGVRIALGAGRGRLLRQLLVESLLLALLGTALGLALTAGAIEVLRTAGAGFVPRLREVAVDVRVLGFALGLAALTSLVFGLLPALQATRVDIRDTLGGARTGLAGERRRTQETLVVVQVALAVLLLAGAGLMIRSLVRLEGVDPGFRTEHVLAVPLSLPASSYPRPGEQRAAYDRLTERLAAIPGVAAVGATSVTPFSGSNLVNDVTPEDRAAGTGAAGYLMAGWRIVSPGYFEAAGIPLLGGRGFTPADRADQPLVAVITRALADRLWPDQDPIGRRFYWGGATGRLRTVIGVVEDIRDFDLEAAPPPVMFLTAGQLAWPAMTLIVRTQPGAGGLGDRIRRAIWDVDPNLPVPDVRAIAERQRASIAEPRFRAGLVAAFATLALVLAAVGLYGVLSFAVLRRTREIGVRLALGARPGNVMTMLMRRGLLVSGVGLVIGLTAALGLSRFVAGMLYETPGTDPLTYGVVAALLGGVAWVAIWIPARRVMAVDPTEALRRGD